MRTAHHDPAPITLPRWLAVVFLIETAAFFGILGYCVHIWMRL
jgi:hypothetical protein